MVQSDTKCQICEYRLLSQAFYMFPCRHAFHRECLITEVGGINPIVIIGTLPSQGVWSLLHTTLVGGVVTVAHHTGRGCGHCCTPHW